MCCAPGISYCKAWLSELSSVSWPVFELSLVSQQECWAVSVTAAWSLRAVAALCRSNECPGSHKSHRVHVQGSSGSFSHRAALGVHVLPHSQQDCHLLHTAPLCKVPVRKSCFIPSQDFIAVCVKNYSDPYPWPLFCTICHNTSFLSLLRMDSSKWLNFLPRWSVFEKYRARISPWGSRQTQVINPFVITC